MLTGKANTSRIPNELKKFGGGILNKLQFEQHFDTLP
jgi:hypothetical protein